MSPDDRSLRPAAFFVFVFAGVLALVLSGLGQHPARKGDTVRVEIVLTLEDGTPVVQQTSTAALGPGAFVEGLWKGVVGMRAGHTKRFTIPPEQAYGARGRTGVIPPNAALDAKVTLIRIEERAASE